MFHLTKYSIWMIIYSTLVLFLSLGSYINITNISHSFDYVIDNWRLAPVNDIYFSNNGSCPWTFEILAPYLWPGTKEGCQCPGGMYYDQPCIDQPLCKSIYGTGPIEFNYILPGISICVHKVYNYSFSELGYRRKCKVMDRSCVLENDHYFCVPVWEKCPITHLVLSQYPIINDLGNMRIYLSRSAPFFPISAGKLTEDKVCKDNSLSNIGPNKKDYFLMNIKRYHCDENDSRWIPFVKVREPDFYNANPSGVHLILPNFTLNYNTLYTYYYKQYIPWKGTDICRDNVIPLNDYNWHIEILTSFQIIVLSFNIIADIILGIYFPYRERKNIIEGVKENDKMVKCEKYCKYGIKICLQLPFFLATTIESGILRYPFKQTSEENCSDDSINEELNDYYLYIDKKIFAVNLVMLLFLFISFGIDIYLFFNQKKEERKIKSIEFGHVNTIEQKSPDRSPELGKSIISQQDNHIIKSFKLDNSPDTIAKSDVAEDQIEEKNIEKKEKTIDKKEKIEKEEKKVEIKKIEALHFLPDD